MDNSGSNNDKANIQPPTHSALPAANSTNDKLQEFPAARKPDKQPSSSEEEFRSQKRKKLVAQEKRELLESKSVNSA